MYLVKKHTDLRLSEIGEIYGMDYAAVAQGCKRLTGEFNDNKKIRRTILGLEEEILY